ncbi:MAG: general secretion pathway protein GspG [Planctomycetota bacterium]|nr:MAG: general secretion pathway protein GspG [Planctomycetota bacterium]
MAIEPTHTPRLRPARSRPHGRRPGGGRARRGFTLVELLIVVVILAILSAVVLPSFKDSSVRAKESSLVATLNTVRQAVSLYRVQHDENYPGQTSWSEFVTQLSTKTWPDGTAGGPYGPYLRTDIPNNPVNHDATGKLVSDIVSATPSGAEGYAYDPDTGELRANVSGDTSDGTAYWDL